MANQKSFSRGDIHLIPFPFTDLSASKLRPAIIIGKDGDDISVVFVTTVKPKGDKYISITPNKDNNLKAPSYIRYTKIATLDINISIGKLGGLDKRTHEDVIKNIISYIN